MIAFPEAFKRRMMSQLGESWPAFERVHETASPVSIRINPRKSYAPPAESVAVPWSTNGYFLKERPVFTLDPLFHAGTYYVQEPSSMFIEQAIRQHAQMNEPLRVLDLCAAPGGKSTHLLALLNDESLLVSNEVIRSRVTVLSENIQKWGHPNVVVTNNDPKDFSALEGYFDIIVVDAPCSGEGLFRKNPQAINEWSEENIAICSQRQKRILQDVWPALKNNGILIYSTCTYNENEDEEIAGFLQQTYAAESLPVTLKPWGIEEVRKGAAVGYKLYPHRVEGEGFFLAILRKQEEMPSFHIKPAKNAFDIPEKKVEKEVSKWLLDGDHSIIRRDDLLQLLPGRYASEIHFMSQRLRVIYAGTFLATLKHNKLVPEHSLALSTCLNEPFPTVPLNEEEALKYLSKENLTINSPDRGFGLATYQGTPLGWMNLLGNRVNNLYPSDWRIRMRLS